MADCTPPATITVDVPPRFPGCLVVVVAGGVDFASAPTLRAALKKALSAHHPRRVVMNCAGLAFCDSSGLGAMVAVHKWLHIAGGQLVLADVSDAVAHKLHVTGLDRVVPIRASTDEALHGVGK